MLPPGIRPRLELMALHGSPRPARTPRPRRTRRFTALIAIATIATSFTACDKPSAFGEADSLIVVSEPELWSELEQPTYAALEPRLTTVRDERTFHVTHVSTASEELDQLLLWRQVLVFGVPESALVQEIVEESSRENDPVAGGDIFQARDVWARGQLATAVVLEPGRRAESWRAALPELADLIDRQFRQYATSRMWVSGVDTAFAERLEERYGVSLRAPQIYHGTVGEDGIIRLRNDRPSPADRIRSILIERRESGAATPGGAEAGAADAPGALDPERVFEWRAGIDSVMYNVPQAIERVDVEPRRFEVEGAEAIQVQGIWRDEGTYPAAGPFIARAVRCPEATWYFDAWLYAPHPEDSKYEYILQLEEILDSFRCATE